MAVHPPVIAGNGWMYRFLFRGPARVSLDAGKVRFENSTGSNVAEISVSSMDDASTSRFLFWTRLTIRTAKWQKYTIGGLSKRKASIVHDAIHENAARNILPLSECLHQVNRQRLTLFSGERYIRHSASRTFLNEHREVIYQIRALCRLEREKLKAVVPGEYDRFVPFTSVETLESEREQANDRFVRSSIPAVRDAAVDTSQAPLTEEQAEAIATDEDVTLVLAGAGTGKTSVIIGKVAYLVRNQGVNPAEILVVAYNTKAAGDIRDRLPVDLAAAPVSTFHAFGLQILADCDVAPSVSELAKDDRQLVKAIEALLDEILEDPDQSEALIKFILYNRAPWRPVFEFETEAEYDEYVRSVELRTLNGDRVKSFEELTIANFLAEHGVEYQYERSYQHQTATSQHRQYQPDFYLPGHDIYIEHFALDEQGNPPPGWTGYAEGVKWKRGIHCEFDTTLIETFSWQHAQDSLLPMLREQFEELGVGFVRIPREILIQKLREQKTSSLSSLLMQFLNHYKTSNLSPNALRERARRHGDRRRNQRFLEVFEQVQERYEQLLEEQNEIDFHDMINRAVPFLRSGSRRSPYRYVLVDEFQDIAAGRMRLLEVLKGESVAYFLVGDDWQSIYRFAGSDIRLVKGCGHYLGHVRRRELTRTFRYGPGILKPSIAFVQRNPEQTQRPLRPASGSKDLGITVVFESDPQAGASHALQEIAADAAGERAAVLVLGRFTFSDVVFHSLPSCDSLRMEFSTIHGVKGRETDYVILLDLNDGRYGIPCRVEDDPLLELVLPPETGRAYPFAEERRLFYVALTRAKAGAWLVTDKYNPSSFVKELIRETDGLRTIGTFSVKSCPRCNAGNLMVSHSRKTLRCTRHPTCRQLAPRCPECAAGYVVVAKHGSFGARCTNPDCQGTFTVCPACGLGILLRIPGKPGRYDPFWGCSTWTRDDPLCTYTE